MMRSDKCWNDEKGCQQHILKVVQGQQKSEKAVEKVDKVNCQQVINMSGLKK